MLLRALPAGSSALMRLAGARRATAELDGYRVRFWTLGPADGEPWLLLHGLGATAASWLPVLPSLRRDCRVVVPELSSLGGTTGPTPGLDIGRGVAVTAGLVRRCFGERPLTVCGASLGGWIGVRLALTEPSLVGRLFLLNCAGFRGEDWQRIQGLVHFERPADIDRLLGAHFVRRPAWIHLARPLMWRVFMSPSVTGVLAALSESDAFDESDLARLEAPVGILWGEEDGLFPLRTGELMARAIPSARLEVLPRCAHVAQWERPRQVNAALRKLRRQLPPRPPQGVTIPLTE